MQTIKVYAVNFHVFLTVVVSPLVIAHQKCAVEQITCLSDANFDFLSSSHADHF